MIKKEYLGYDIYVYDMYFIELAKEIIEKKVRIEKELKKTPRNYVAQIKFKSDRYILKSPRNEHRIILRKIKTLILKGEALSTLINVNKAIKNGLTELYKPYIAIEKREKGMIVESFLITEFIDGKVIENYKEISDKEKQKIVNGLEKMHSLNIFHGDANHTNFIFKESGELKIIDTKAKTEIFTYKRNYDFITLDDCIKNIELFHSFNKLDVFYYLAYFTKKIKKLSFLKKLKSLKEKFRKKY